ncbi:MAG: ATP-binding protein [Polyangiaceae bacterium]
MQQGGHIVIETQNVDRLVSNLLSADAPINRGHVMLAVSDTGCGMNEATLARIFEPFFTTKGLGKGTGLGLSTVYGIIKQSGGEVVVNSAPKQGTTFQIYLPRHDALVCKGTEHSVPLAIAGRETILLVEDDEAVRKLTERILRSAGYDVLAAASPGDALILCERRGEDIELLVTDVVMPQLSGRELAERITSLIPRVKVLYISGYTDDFIVHHGVLDSALN